MKKIVLILLMFLISSFVFAEETGRVEGVAMWKNRNLSDIPATGAECVLLHEKDPFVLFLVSLSAMDLDSSYPPLSNYDKDFSFGKTSVRNVLSQTKERIKQNKEKWSFPDKKETLVDGTGRFVFSSIKPGNYFIVISQRGTRFIDSGSASKLWVLPVIVESGQASSVTATFNASFSYQVARDFYNENLKGLWFFYKKQYNEDFSIIIKQAKEQTIELLKDEEGLRANLIKNLQMETDEAKELNAKKLIAGLKESLKIIEDFEKEGAETGF